MIITFVTKDKNKPEKWKRVDLVENPFENIVKEGETIPIDNILDFITYPNFLRNSDIRKIQKFCLHRTIEDYIDIRYYYDHGQN